MELPDKQSLRERYHDCDDQQLLHILTHRHDYQEQLIEVVKELIQERGLQDVDQLDGNIAESRRAHFHFFPVMEKSEQRQSLIASLTRLMYLISLFPLIETGLFWTSGDWDNVFHFGGVALLWLVVTFIQDRHKKPAMVWGQLGLVGLTVILLRVSRSTISFGIQWRDWIIGGMSLAVIVYLIIYLYQLLIAETRNS